MADKKITVTVKPLIKKLGKGFELHVVAMKPKNSNISWRAIIADYNEIKDGNLVAIFDKPLKRSDFTADIQGHEIQLNDNGVQATYRDWKAKVEDTFDIKIPWQPTGRAMFRLDL